VYFSPPGLERRFLVDKYTLLLVPYIPIVVAFFAILRELKGVHIAINSKVDRLVAATEKLAFAAGETAEKTRQAAKLASKAAEITSEAAKIVDEIKQVKDDENHG
jgi:hypothetical protein